VASWASSALGSSTTKSSHEGTVVGSHAVLAGALSSVRLECSSFAWNSFHGSSGAVVSSCTSGGSSGGGKTLRTEFIDRAGYNISE